MDKLVNENGPRTEGLGYGTLNRRIVLIVIAGSLCGPANPNRRSNEFWPINEEGESARRLPLPRT